MQSLVLRELQRDTMNDHNGDATNMVFGDALFSKGVELLAKQMNRALSVLEAMEINSIAALMAQGFLSRMNRNNEKSLQSNIRNTVGIDLQGQIRAEGLDAVLDVKIAENVALIKSIKNQYIEDIGGVLRENIMEGGRSTDLITQIKERGNVTKNRAKFIARDQTAKANADLTQLRSEALGAKTYIWSGSMDERERAEHKAMEGLMGRWDDPTVYSDDNGETWKTRSSIGAVKLHPGRDYNCRCVALPIVNFS